MNDFVLTVIVAGLVAQAVIVTVFCWAAFQRLDNQKKMIDARAHRDDFATVRDKHYILQCDFELLCKHCGVEIVKTPTRRVVKELQK